MELISGVQIKRLSMIPDERGRLVEILRADDPMFEQFGQIYLTTVYPGVTKAWHYHKLQADHFCAIVGMIKLVLYDNRPQSPTQARINEFFIGESNLMVVKIPPLVYHGFKGIGTRETMVLNLPTRPYNHAEPDEYRLDPHTDEIPYRWALKEY